MLGPGSRRACTALHPAQTRPSLDCRGGSTGRASQHNGTSHLTAPLRQAGWDVSEWRPRQGPRVTFRAPLTGHRAVPPSLLTSGREPRRMNTLPWPMSAQVSGLRPIRARTEATGSVARARREGRTRALGTSCAAARDAHLSPSRAPDAGTLELPPSTQSSGSPEPRRPRAAALSPESTTRASQRLLQERHEGWPPASGA